MAFDDASLYCFEAEESIECLSEETNPFNNINFLKSPLFEQDLFWEDTELVSLFTKETETQSSIFASIETNLLLAQARKKAVEWIVKVNFHFGFSSLTIILAINYLDRYLANLHYNGDKPWMIQLAAVTCLSLAAKVEETNYPRSLDLQVVEAERFFDAITVKRMELMVLSALKWRMNPVTPFSFLDHIIRRLGLKNNLHWEFLRRSENLLLTIVADARFVRYLPSILATATMLHVIHQVEPCKTVDYQKQLLDVLKLSKEKLNSCYELIAELVGPARKRKYDQDPRSIDSLFCSEISSNSWELNESEAESSCKKRRISEQTHCLN